MQEEIEISERQETIQHNGEKLYILKCDFHAHFSEYNDDPSNTISVFRQADYDVMALTEHNGLHKDFEMERTFADKAAKLYGDKFIVNVGDEVRANDSEHSGHEAIHIL